MESTKNKKLYPILIFIFVLFYFYPSISRNIWINYLRIFCTVLEAIIIFLKYFQHLKIKKTNRAISIIALFYLLLFSISVFKKVDYGTLSELMNIIAFITLLLFTDLSVKQNSKSTKAILAALFILVMWDCLGILLNPNGLYQVAYSTNDVNTQQWLFGNKNNHTAMFMLLMLYTINYETHKKRKSTKIFTIFCFAFTTISSFVLNSSTTILICVILSFCYASSLIFKNTNRVLSKIQNKIDIILPAYLILNILFVLGNTLFLNSFSQLFGKTSTFSGRTELWSRTLLTIIQQPIFGYGKIDASTAYNYINSVNPHNAILGCMLYGGIILTIIYLGILVVVKNSIKQLNDKSFFLVMVMFICVLIRSLVEQTATNQDTMFLLFSINLLCNNSNNNIIVGKRYEQQEK